MVKMTSQGIGGPFQLSEQIMGYQVCQMKGNVYIDQDEWYGEKLTNIQKNDEICFRYFQVKEKIKGIYINCRGNAVIELFSISIKSESISYPIIKRIIHSHF